MTSIKANAQSMVLKPSDLINPWMNLSEWIIRNANLTYDSYDINTFNVHWNTYSSRIDVVPLIFIDGVKYNTSLIESNNLIIPNISPNTIDSIIVNLDEKYVNGYFAEKGSIQIFLKKKGSSLYYEKGLANEINDPGPHSSSELKSQNVEVIDISEKATLWFPKKWKSSLALTRNRYSRTNFHIYDDEVNRRLFTRTLADDNSGDIRLQRNLINNALLTNSFTTNSIDVRLLTSYTNKNNYYLWSPLAGIELPFSMKRFQTGVNIQPKSIGFFKGFSTHISHSNYDSLYNAGSKAFEMEELSFDQSMALQFSKKISLNIETNIQKWSDQITLKSNYTSSWKSSLIYQDNFQYLLQVGNYEQGVSINSLKNGSSISFNTFRINLNRLGYNYTLAKNGVGFSLLNNLENRITNDSDLVNFYSGIKYKKRIKTHLLTLSGSVEMKHYWNLSDFKTEYEYLPNSLILSTNVNYYDSKNIGLLNYNITVGVSLSPVLSSRTALTSNINTYGSTTFDDNYQRVPTWNFLQSVKYNLDENVVFEINYSYIPARKINEFKMLEDDLGWPSVRVRPINLLSSTAKLLFFDKSLAMSISLRNLLDSVESYNTNGQYYNMSIYVSASLALGKK